MSAILSADDLNDFISPGVACIKPIETLPQAQTDDRSGGVILDGQQTQVQAQTPAQISLTDCLACSGCVTSAEAVLVSLQSHAEVLASLDAAPALRVRADKTAARGFAVDGLENEHARLFVASVSPQTTANLAAAAASGGAHVSSTEAGHMLDGLLRGPAGLAGSGPWRNGFSWVVDINSVRHASLVLAADEVLDESTATRPSRPVLASSCPGWVCYAEKTHPHVLPHLSRIKSPQALTGIMLKTLLGKTLGIPPSRVWHLAVMPCFDKKLEASRQELTDSAWAGASGQGVRDVDCVITTKEVLMLSESRGINFFAMAKDGSAAPEPPPLPDQRLHDVLFPNGDIALGNPPRAAGPSGGLLHYILQARAAQTPGAEIHTMRGRNADVVDYLITLNGEAIFKAARYYGFRNIQNLVRRLKPVRPSRMPGGKPIGSARRPVGKAASIEYSYVEVMACPGGCTNGGGQIKADDAVMMGSKGYTTKPGPQEQKDWLAEVDEAYFSSNETAQENGGLAEKHAIGSVSASQVHDMLAHWSDLVGIDIDRLTLTSFREIMSDVGKTDQVVRLANKIGGGW